MQLNIFETSYQQAYNKAKSAYDFMNDIQKRFYKDGWLVGATGALSEYDEFLYSVSDPLLRLGYRDGLETPVDSDFCNADELAQAKKCVLGCLAYNPFIDSAA